MDELLTTIKLLAIRLDPTQDDITTDHALGELAAAVQAAREHIDAQWRANWAEKAPHKKVITSQAELAATLSDLGLD